MGLFSALLDLLYPPRCVFCRRLLPSSGSGICLDCKRVIPRTEHGGTKRGYRFSRCAAPLYYEGPVRASLLRYKFGGLSLYAETYGPLLADCIRENLAGSYDRITWVPLSRERLRRRGYDQARLLAESAAAALGTRAVPLLEKPRNTQRQSGTGAAQQRRANIAGAYRAAAPELTAGARILLIDDIVTTGATMDECAGVLLDAGAADVVCAALAVTRD